jgi:hypothetical protein
MQVSDIMRGLDEGSLYIVHDANTFEPFYTDGKFRPRQVPEEVFEWQEILIAYKNKNMFLFNRLLGL